MRLTQFKAIRSVLVADLFLSCLGHFRVENNGKSLSTHTYTHNCNNKCKGPKEKASQTSMIDLTAIRWICKLESLLGETYFRAPAHATLYAFLIISLVGIFAYWLFYVPCNWSKQLEDISYSVALRGEGKMSAMGKKYAINRLRRMRNVGTKELPPPFPNGWYYVIESSKLKAGASLSVACLGEQLVVYRTQEGEVFVLDAYCPHLGANLGVGGKVVGNNIECPFHQWSFRGTDGICTNIPYSTCVPQGSQVRKWISREINDSVFVWYHAEKSEEFWELPVIKEIERKEFVYHGRNEFYVNCHIQEIPENGADLAHFTAIHIDSILAGGTDAKNSILANVGAHHWQAVWKPAQGSDNHLARIALKHSLHLTQKIHCFCMDVKGEQIGPSYVQLHMDSPTMGRIKVLQTITPIEPLVQKVVHRFYARRAIAPFMKILIFGESVMFERDIAIWNHKIFRSNPKLVKEDAALKKFRHWYSQFYTANSKLFIEAQNRFDW